MPVPGEAEQEDEGMIGQSPERALLSVRKLPKHFGGTTALESVDAHVTRAQD